MIDNIYEHQDGKEIQDREAATGNGVIQIHFFILLNV